MTFENEVLVALCAVAVFILVVVAFHPRRPSSGHKQYRAHSRFDQTNSHTVVQFKPEEGKSAASDFSMVAAQLDSIMRAAFQKRRVMNVSEYRVFKAVEDEIAAVKKGHRAFAQTSLEEVLESPDRDAFHSINAKRVDILVVDKGGWPVFAVEYQGPGHYQGTAAARDAIKKEALRRAGVGYIEVTQEDGEDQVRLRIREQLGTGAPDPIVGRKNSLPAAVAAPSSAH